MFFSYSRADAKFALKLATDLKNAGVNLWIDQLNIPPGVRWDAEIEKSLEASNSLLVILSDSSVRSDNVLDEVSHALENNKQVFPIIIDNCKIPFRLKRLQHIDFTADYGTAFNRLLQALSDFTQSDLVRLQQLSNKEEKKNEKVQTLKIEEKENKEREKQQGTFLKFFIKKWNLVIPIVIIITALISRFTVPPAFEPQSLYDDQNYTAYSKFTVAGILALSLVPCYFFNNKKHVWVWWIPAFIMLVTGIILNINYNNYKANVVLNPVEFEYGKLVKGDDYLPEVQKIRNSYKQSNGSYPTDKGLVAGFGGDHSRVWPKKEILSNTTSIIIRYMGMLVCFTLFIIFSIQALYCLEQPKET